MTLLAYPHANGTVILAGHHITAKDSGRRVRLVVTHAAGDTITGTELRRHFTKTLKLIKQAGGRFLVDTDGRVWVRGNVRTVTVDQVVTVHRAREVGAT